VIITPRKASLGQLSKVVIFYFINK
jgi:hypothetical protein